jgi:hypothetical protein
VKTPHFDPNDENEFYGQFKWKEICCDPRDLNNYVGPEQNPHRAEQIAIIKEAREKARHTLIQRLLELVEDFFTTHQKKVFFLMRKGKTYQEIATILGEQYSSERSGYTSIAYAIKGIKSKVHGKHHGGIERKLRKLCLRDSMCRQILHDLKALEKDDIDIAINYLKKFDDWYIEFDDQRDKDPPVP